MIRKFKTKYNNKLINNQLLQLHNDLQGIYSVENMIYAEESYFLVKKKCISINRKVNNINFVLVYKVYIKFTFAYHCKIILCNTSHLIIKHFINQYIYHQSLIPKNY